MSESVPIPFIGASGLINLGPANPSAVKRMANYAQEVIRSGLPIPPSPFVEWVADRICGEDKQDLVFFLEGRRGSGKSYSCLYLGKRFAEAIARRMGGTWKDYFSMENCATLEDTERVLALLSKIFSRQVILIDDAAIAISNRSWNSPQNRNWNALLMVARTNRWVILLTAPLRKHVDNQTREMCDVTAMVYRSFHKGGFNIIKMHSSDIGASGKEYSRRMNFHKRKVDFWVAFKPDPELTKEYDVLRDESAKKLNLRIVETGSFKGGGSSGSNKKLTRAERDERKEQELTTMYFEKAHRLLNEGSSERSVIKACPGLTTTYLTRIRQKGGF